MARPASRSTPTKRKTPSGTAARTTPAPPPPAFPPGVGPGARPPLTAAKKPLSYHLISGALVLVLLLTSSLAIYSIRQLLRPLFGGSAAVQYAQVLTIALCAPSVLLPMVEPHIALSVLGTVVAIAPVVVYQVGRAVVRLSWTAELGPGIGAVLAQIGVVLPIVVVTVNLMKRWMPDQDYQLNGSIRAGFTTYAGLHSLGPIYSALLPHNDLVNPCNVLSAVAVALVLMSILVPDEDPASLAAATTDGVAPAPAEKTKGKGKENEEPGLIKSGIKLGLLGLPVLVMSLPRLAVTNPFGPGVLRMSNCAPINYAGGDVRVLARADSVTGTLIVADNLKQGFRYLRCDNSLLGGTWLDSDAQEGAAGESIFATFDLQQAVMLVDRPKQADEKALVIGLGIGVLPKALIAHGITPTILEVDPLIAPYARHFFSFPETPTQIAEGRGWLSQQTALRTNGSLSPADAAEQAYAIVVHDVFTGDHVPAHMFSEEVFAEIKGVMTPDGVLAVNFGSRLGSNVSRALWLTLLHVFGNCRAFHDLPIPVSSQDPRQPETESILNIVIFCTPSPSPLTFHAPPRTFSASRTTQQVLSTLAQRELTPAQLVGRISEHLEEQDWIVKEVRNYLDKWSGPDAGEHWTAMRKVMSAEAWDTY